MKQTSAHYPTTPSQKLTQLGPNPLSDEDLLSILLTRSPKHPPTPTLTRSVLTQLDTLNDHLTTTDLTSLPGITQSQATHLLAAFEFTRRRIKPAHLRISTPEDIATLTRHYATRPQEHFICISLNGAHEVIAIRCVTIGLVNSTQVRMGGSVFRGSIPKIYRPWAIFAETDLYFVR